MRPANGIFLLIVAAFGCLFSGSFGASVLAQELPSTVSIGQWRDSFLAKWQSGTETDKNDAVIQLASLLLLMSDTDPLRNPLLDRLRMHSSESPDAGMAIALAKLESDHPEEASQLLLDLILRHPDDKRISRWRIALARSFRLEGQLDMASTQLEPMLSPETESGRWAIIEQVSIYKEKGEFEKAYAMLERFDPIDLNSDYLFSIIKAEREALEMRRSLSREVGLE